MDTHQLEVYIAAAQYLNFTKASKQLNMVPSAVSHSISMLENELHAKLFTRDNNKLNLTEAGQEFLRDAIRITTIANNAISREKIQAGEPGGMVHMGFVFPEFIYSYIPQMTAFHEEFPNVEITSMQYDSITLSRMLSDKKLDVAFGRQDMFAGDSSIQWRSLYKDEFLIVYHKDHPLAKEEHITIPMLKKERILVMNRSVNPGMFDMIQHLFLSHGMIPRLHDLTNHHFTTLILAAMKLGVVIIPNLNTCYTKLPDVLEYQVLNDENAHHEIGIAWNNDNITFPLKKFLEKFEIQV